MDIMQQPMGPSDFAKEIERLKSAGKLPTLHQTLSAVSETRKTYRPQILKAREQGEDNASNS